MWPAIRDRVPAGDPMFSAVNPRNFNRILRAAMRRLDVPDSGRYSSHGFRRGAEQDLNVDGSTCAVVATAGTWNPPAFCGYDDLTADLEQGVKNLPPLGA